MKVRLVDRFFVLRLKIHCCAVESQRKAVSLLVEMMSSVTFCCTVPLRTWYRMKEETTPGVPTDTPFASHTRNFTGTVLFCLNTLVPSALIGCRTWWPASPSHMPAAA